MKHCFRKHFFGVYGMAENAYPVTILYKEWKNNIGNLWCPFVRAPLILQTLGKLLIWERYNTFLVCIGNQNRPDLLYAHEGGESTSHAFAFSWHLVRMLLRMWFKVRLWRKQLLYNHVNNCYLSQSKLCRRPEALSIRVGNKMNAGGYVEPDELGNHQGCDF